MQNDLCLNNQFTFRKSNETNWMFVIASSLLLYSRLLSAIGLPTAINLVHYGLFFLWYVIVKIFGGMKLKKTDAPVLTMFVCIVFAALINKVSVVNVFLEFLLITQPFILFVILKDNRLSKRLVDRTLTIVFIVNMLFSFAQYFFFGLKSDGNKGIFLHFCMGHHVNGAIAIIACLYFYKKDYSLFIKIPIILLEALTVFLCDNKQSIAILFLAFAVLLLVSKPKQLIKILVPLILIAAVFLILVYEIESLNKVFGHFFENSAGSGEFQKLLFGFGPGMTCGRLAQMLPEYSILDALGATSPSQYSNIFELQQSHWLTHTTTGSSFFALLFSLAGVFGDLGIVGVLLLLFFYFYFFRKLKDNVSKLIFLYFFIHGCVFQWWEEPAFVFCCFVSIVVLEKKKSTTLID